MAGKQIGNNTRLATTVTPFQYFLVQSAGAVGNSLMLSTKSPRGSLAQFIMELIEKHFSEKYQMPIFLLQDILEHSGVMEPVPDVDEKSAKPKYYPVDADVIQAVVDDYKRRLYDFNYNSAGTEADDESNNHN